MPALAVKVTRAEVVRTGSKKVPALGWCGVCGPGAQML